MIRMVALFLSVGMSVSMAANYPEFVPAAPSFELTQSELESQVYSWGDAWLKDTFGNERLSLAISGNPRLIEAAIVEQARIIDSNALRIVQAQNRMPMIWQIANNGSGIVCGVDSLYGVGATAGNRQQAVAHLRMGYLWQTYLDNDAEDAFRFLASRAPRPRVSEADLVLLQGCIGYTPGERTAQKIDKTVWMQLHGSTNPVYRFIALEKFDSTPQSRNELLALYRECLFGACSYLEMRVFEAIINNNDLRDEVAKLLEEYRASNPPSNDGTLPRLRNRFPNLLEGAEQIIQRIRSGPPPVASFSTSQDPFAQTARNFDRTQKMEQFGPKQDRGAESERTKVSLWRRWLPLTLCLLIVVGVLWLVKTRRR